MAMASKCVCYAPWLRAEIGQEFLYKRGENKNADLVCCAGNAAGPFCRGCDFGRLRVFGQPW